MALPDRLVVLDVGHGNCSILHSAGKVGVIDAGPGPALLEYLTREKISRLEWVVLSHADQDHVAGLLTLLASGLIAVDAVYVNSDSEKETKLWEGLRLQLRQGYNRGMAFHVGLSTQTGELLLGSAVVRVEGPSPYLLMGGVGSRANGRRITSNSISAVLRVFSGGKSIAVLAADIDTVGMDDLLASGRSLHADVAVFPHHGGSSGGDSALFSEAFANATKANTVVFSIGRGRYATPNPVVVSTVRAVLPGVRIVCTQLSMHCAAEKPRPEPRHLAPVFSVGRVNRACCSGSLVIPLDGSKMLPAKKAHVTYIHQVAAKPMCQ